MKYKGKHAVALSSATRQRHKQEAVIVHMSSLVCSQPLMTNASVIDRVKICSVHTRKLYGRTTHLSTERRIQ